MNRLFENVNCNLCNSNNYKVIFESRYDNETQSDLTQKFRSSGDEQLIDQVVKCNNCGLVYINPRLKSDLIIEGYSEGDDNMFVSQSRGREITFEKNLKIIEKTMKNQGLKCPGKILDIGSANGSFLYVAKKNKWDVSGVEPNNWMCDWAKKHYKITIKPGTLTDYKFKNENYDVLSLWDVLEHVPDPMGTLRECNSLLKRNGILVVNYPDFGSLPAKILKRKWVFLLSVHLYYFTPNTIKKMLRKAGFEVILIKPHFQSLELGYLIERSKPYSRLAHAIGKKIIDLLGLEHMQIKYWIGQTLVIAKKK